MTNSIVTHTTNLAQIKKLAKPNIPRINTIPSIITRTINIKDRFSPTIFLLFAKYFSRTNSLWLSQSNT